MKKRVLVLIIVLLIIVCGCNSIKKNDTNGQTKNKMVGEYVLTSIKEKDKTYTKKEIEKLKKNYRIIIFNNNQAEFYLKKKRYSATYDKNFFIGQDKKKKEIKLEYKYNKNTITINYYNGVYVFKK